MVIPDEQIVKALEICSDKLTISCPDDCPFYDECEKDICALERKALDLINRQKAEIERLKAVLKEETNKMVYSYIEDIIDNVAQELTEGGNEE